VKNPFILELFNPAPKALLQQMGRACPNFSLEISPESHDYEVRKAIGRNYTDKALEQTIADALDVGCGRLDIFYMIGLTKQTPQSALDTIDYCDYLLKKFNSDKRLCLFTSPLAPFLDPGSLGFEQPERHGYRVLFRSLEEHRQALVSPLWKYSLNFETEWMSRQQIMDTAYDAILRLNQVKLKHGVIPENLARISEQRLKSAWDMAHRIDDLLGQGRHEEIEALKPEVDSINSFPVAEKIQLEVAPPLLPIKPFHALWSVLTGK
jgi:radical SAM superfamily enzyme YgiQ (UPF0313 family)